LFFNRNNFVRQNIVKLKEKTDNDLKSIKKKFVEEESKFLELKGKLFVVLKIANRLKEIEWLSWQPIVKIFSHVDKLKKRLKKKKWSTVQIIDQIKSKRKVIKQQQYYLKKTQLYVKLKQQNDKKKQQLLSLQRQRLKKKKETIKI
jgi:hypothetical protein